MFCSIWNRSSKNYKIPKKKETITLRSGLIRKKFQFPRFPCFRFCPIPKNENSEISESFISIKFLVVYKTQNQKHDLKEKTLTLQCGLRRKMSISGVSRFSILPNIWNWKFGNLKKMSFTSIFYRFGCIKHGEA